MTQTFDFNDIFTIKGNEIFTKGRLGLYKPNEPDHYWVIKTGTEIFGIHSEEPNRLILLNKANYSSPDVEYTYVGPIKSIQIVTENL